MTDAAEILGRWWGETTGQDGGIDTPLSFEEYAARLSGGRTWWFWWD